ncbi:hypothetical protein CRG98_010200 [Punica granatum]|uniref:Uncharacterized protein n=1 Tax=Punica granatum TaxID=22663 RepID=A0A2I0KLL2_PUNGR|nr:hypothetical protein CRG98_010200 [Punica granatum]
MECCWRELYEEWDLAENKWLSNLYSLRDKWGPAFNRDIFSAGIRSTQRSESTNKVFKQMSCGTMTLTEFVNHYEKRAEKMREAQAMDDFECVSGRPRRIVNTGIIKHASEVYTIHSFRKFQEEFLAVMEWRVANTHVEDAACTFVMVQEFGQRQHTVHFNVNELTIACTCKFFESKGVSPRANYGHGGSGLATLTEDPAPRDDGGLGT